MFSSSQPHFSQMFILGKSYAKPGNKVIVTNGELERWVFYYSFGEPGIIQCATYSEPFRCHQHHHHHLSLLPQLHGHEKQGAWLVSLWTCLPDFFIPSFDWPRCVFKTNVWEKELSFLYSLLWRPLLLSRGEELASGGLGAGKVVISYQTGLLRWGDDCYMWKLIL